MDAGDIVEAVVGDDDAGNLVEKGFEYQKRKHHDVCFSVFYSVLMTFCGGVAIFAFINKNEDWTQLYHQDYRTDEKFCTASTPAPPNPPVLPILEASTLEASSVAVSFFFDDLKEDAFNKLKTGSFWGFLDHAWIWLLGATLGAVVLGFVFLMLFSYFAIGMVYLTVSIITAIPIAAGIYELVDGNSILGGVLVGVGLILCLLFMCLRTKLNMVAKLLDSAADGVRENLQLVIFALGTMLMVVIVSVVLVFLGAVAFTNGEFEVNRKNFQFKEGTGCVSSSGRPVSCCKFNKANWLIPYYVLLAFMILWNVFLLSQIRVFVVSGVIAQWYFADEGEIHVHGKTRRSLGHALGPSFGSLCLSSIILTIGEMIRWLAEKMKRENDDNWCCWLINCCVQGIISMLEFLTGFATVHMAISGESFWESGKDTVQMLKRNFINAYAIWWVPPIILGLTGVVLGGSVSAVLGTAAYATWKDDLNSDVVKKYPIYLGVCTFLLIMVVILFFSRVLLDTVSAVFVCFAMDRDNRKETRHKIHEVMCMMPSVGPMGEDDKTKPETRDRGLPYEAPPLV